MPSALDDLEYWKKSGNTNILKKIRDLLASIELTPYSGTGKPEALKHSWSGWWSRRINKEHRLIYKVEQNTITVFALRFHYD
ncbi:toxin YoeB [Pedobacter sp. ok626]|nr:toxin YoeB [Pedobacter sp. ok626]